MCMQSLLRLPAMRSQDVEIGRDFYILVRPTHCGQLIMISSNNDDVLSTCAQAAYNNTIEVDLNDSADAIPHVSNVCAAVFDRLSSYLMCAMCNCMFQLCS